ncbi:methyl-accepting chemotaxis protein [Roseateles sp. BYS78W]|uniref:Methyl-accepting chemotaxis protein n=1 Tax=Pelomonas candidula TaxID=3299025 RepID=A0ABW7HCX5_9BURK
MNLRNLNIGPRLALGFGVILIAASAMVVGALVASGASRGALLDTLQQAAARQELAVEMQAHLLSSAVAVRNMGLQSEVDGVQRDEKRAKDERAAYVAAKGKIEAQDLSADEKALFGRLENIDAEMNARFKEAVDLAAQFNTEQAGKIITEKIDPLLTRAATELAGFIQLQKQRTQAATELANASHRRTVISLTALGVVMLLGAVFIAWQLTRSITAPLQVAVEVTGRVSLGDLATDIKVTGRDEAARLLEGLQQMRLSLSRLVQEVRDGAEGISGGASEIATGNADLSHRTESQASSLEETAASVEQLSATVRSNADTAQQADREASTASQAATRGGQIVGQVVATMGEISTASRKIADIIGVIDGIAFQTNILALNAAVEAARAGEQGRGFAVVAGEVRTLAGRAADAAKEIKSLIGASVERVEAGTRLVDEAGASMQDIVAQVSRVATLIGEISSSALEQTSGIGQINQAITSLDQVTQQNAALVEQAAAAADSLNQQAVRMVEAVSVFKLR